MIFLLQRDSSSILGENIKISPTDPISGYPESPPFGTKTKWLKE
jgi:hypothetical protein